MKRFVVKFNDQFWGGLLVGAALGVLLVGAGAYERIQENVQFGDAMMQAMFAATDDIERLKEACGKQCEGFELTYPHEIDKLTSTK
jgi:hypothetical protein